MYGFPPHWRFGCVDQALTVLIAGFDGSGNLGFGLKPTEMALFPEVETNFDVSLRPCPISAIANC